MRAPLMVAVLTLASLAATIPASGTPGGAGGAFTCDFGVSFDMPLDELAPAIERDRMYMAERPGMLFKHIPMRPSPLDGAIFSGGRYLFDTEENARDYLRWMREDFQLGGVMFLDRPEFIAPDCHAWRTHGSATLGDIHTEQVALRTERWALPPGVTERAVSYQWANIAREAEERSLSAVWLLYEPDARLASIVSYAAPLAPLRPDLSLVQLETMPTMGPVFTGAGWEKTLDRTSLSMNIWFPYAFADSGEASIWANSPPIPGPRADDGVCVPSRGETHASAPDDCTPTCGDGILDADETWQRCPSDVRYDW